MLRPNSHMAVRGFTLRSSARFCRLVCSSSVATPHHTSSSAEIDTARLATAPQKSIAILPFENLSDDKANAYFAEGVKDEILTKLAAVRDLKVISRTSTAKYQSKPDNLKAVAQELGVSTILEGAVQRAANQVRVNVQLIDAATDTHLWAKSYDRDFKDVLGVQSAIAEEIAEALKANLSPSESHVLAAIRTQNTEAYDLFLRAQYEFHQAQSTLVTDAFDRADAFYQQALARDPNFAEAAAGLAHSRLNAALVRLSVVATRIRGGEVDHRSCTSSGSKFTRSTRCTRGIFLLGSSPIRRRGGRI